jgi:hypothetical protein
MWPSLSSNRPLSSSHSSSRAVSMNRLRWAESVVFVPPDFTELNSPVFLYNKQDDKRRQAIAKPSDLVIEIMAGPDPASRHFIV